VRVSDATRQRIFDAARELRYRPNSAGRALKSARTRVIGLVVPDLIRRVEDDEKADVTITDPAPELVVRESTAPYET
jgi:cytochrome c-type biogenesis protein CcmE